jgi:hypothetical protein
VPGTSCAARRGRSTASSAPATGRAWCSRSARIPGRGVRFPVNALALKHGAGVTRETTDPRQAYADVAPDREIGAPAEFPPF